MIGNRLLCGRGPVRHHCGVSVQAITPAGGPVDAEVRVPGSKSLTNRAMCMAALASGTSTLHNALFSDDTRYFGEALRALGIEVREDADAATISVDGQGGAIPAPKADLFVGNAGTAARFLTALLALGEGCYTVDGVPRMRERPIDELLTALTAQGARITSHSEPPRMPFTICGAGLAGGHLEISGMRSSQPISALLMVAPLARAATTVHITGTLVSKPFVGMTTRLMEQFGVHAGGGSSSLYIAAGQRYHPVNMVIEPDATNASYFFAAAAVTGGRVTVAGLTRNSLQGDLAFLEVLRQMRCKVRWRGDTVTVQGPAQLAGVEVNLAPISGHRAHAGGNRAVRQGAGDHPRHRPHPFAGNRPGHRDGHRTAPPRGAGGGARRRPAHRAGRPAPRHRRNLRRPPHGNGVRGHRPARARHRHRRPRLHRQDLPRLLHPLRPTGGLTDNSPSCAGQQRVSRAPLAAAGRLPARPRYRRGLAPG